MTVAIICLTFLLVLTLVAWSKDRADLLKELGRMADRIQHPEIRQVEPGEIVQHDPPRDAEEMAQVGQEVPEFVQVGSNHD